MTELEDALRRSDAEIVNNWILSVGRMPSAGRMPLGSYLVNFGPFDLIFDPL